MNNKRLQVSIPSELYETLDKLRDTYIQAGLDLTRKDLIGTLLLRETHAQLLDLQENGVEKATENMELNYLYYTQYYK